LGSERLNELSRVLGYSIIGQGLNLVSGFGIGIAEQTILGAFHAIYESAKAQPAERVLIRPFPGHTPVSARESAFRRHREDLISRVGALVVLAGNKVGPDGRAVPSTGVEEEVEIALSLGKPIIPVGMSGHVAQKTWIAANAEPDRYLPGIECKRELSILGNADSTNEQVVAAVISLLQRAERIASTKN
jgi:hypothetical protein